MSYIVYVLLAILCELSVEAQLSIQNINQTSEQEFSSQISAKELNRWDKIVKNLLIEKPLDVGNTNRLYAYLYNAQKAFADASLADTGHYNGSIGPISKKIIQLFYPNFKENGKQPDSLSEKLTPIVFKKFFMRFEQEKQEMQPFKLQMTEAKWKGKEPYDGLENATMKLWVITKADEFRLTEPPQANDQAFWRNQLDIVKNRLKNVTEEQKQITLFWAGKSGPDSGDWIAIANAYMDENNVPLSKRLEVRAKLATALFETMVAVYDSKYTYLVKRPFMLDLTIETLIDTPNHPSYPAGHSADSAAAATIMSYYFPENSKKWQQMGEEAGLSRIWSGLHFPIDHEKGAELGKQVANAVLNR